MGLAPDLALGATARQFAEMLLARFPEWEAWMTPYARASDADETPSGSLWLDVPSPGDPLVHLWAIVQDGEALVGLGERAGEKLFVWPPEEKDDGLRSVLAFIDDVVTAEEVVAWERTRFLWWKWDTGQFRRAADVIGDKRVVRVSAFPAPVNANSHP